MFALTLKRAHRSMSAVRQPITSLPNVSCGAVSQRGSRTAKSVNDDAFLISELPGGLWLLAVADGVSKPSHGWWASDKCTELLWRSADGFSRKLEAADSRDRELELMNEWIRSIHEDFIAERRRQSLTDYQSATTTLTFAIVRGRHLLYANSGDTPLYVFQKQRGGLKKVIDVWASSRSKLRGQVHLTQHMAASTKNWRPMVGTTELQRGDLVVVCSDGVASGDRWTEKHSLLNRGLGDEHRDLQTRVAGVLTQIAELGEADDLTLLAFQPEERV
jgi:serine/threonine protein phosphatase PrpC